jgi:hypothetical protein
MEISSWSPGDNGRSLKPVEPQHAYFLNGGSANGGSAPSYQTSRAVAAIAPPTPEMAPAPAVNGSFEDFLKAQGQGW